MSLSIIDNREMMMANHPARISLYREKEEKRNLPGGDDKCVGSAIASAMFCRSFVNHIPLSFAKDAQQPHDSNAFKIFPLLANISLFFYFYIYPLLTKFSSFFRRFFIFFNPNIQITIILLLWKFINPLTGILIALFSLSLSLFCTLRTNVICIYNKSPRWRI